jgi:hypothetical protein
MRVLVTCMSLAFSTAAAAAGADHDPLRLLRSPTTAAAGSLLSAAAPVTHIVTTCDDTGVAPTCDGQDDGTLRKAFSCAGNGDTIDLSQLRCSRITLATALVSGPGDLILRGPADATLTLDGDGRSRVLVHEGGAYGTLLIDHLTVANGHYDKPFAVGGGGGGCIFSSGNVALDSSTVTSCYTSAASADALGGAIYAIHAVGLYRSTVSDSKAQSKGLNPSLGGGIYADIVELNQSTVSGNSVTTANTISFGGGIAGNLIDAFFSTVSGNKADRMAGIDGQRVFLTDSTVSGNRTPAGGRIGGVYARQNATIIGSTIAGNSSGSGYAAGLFVAFAAAAELDSTIIAGNTAGGVELDAGSNTVGTIPGRNNLIMAHQPGTTLPSDTLTDDPLLGLLQDNGGPTQTHALSPGSPAIDHGNDSSGPIFDQRLRPRIIGALADIGAYEFDPDSILTTGFGN